MTHEREMGKQTEPAKVQNLAILDVDAPVVTAVLFGQTRTVRETLRAGRAETGHAVAIGAVARLESDRAAPPGTRRGRSPGRRGRYSVPDAKAGKSRRARGAGETVTVAKVAATPPAR